MICKFSFKVLVFGIIHDLNVKMKYGVLGNSNIAKFFKNLSKLRG